MKVNLIVLQTTYTALLASDRESYLELSLNSQV